MTWCCSACTFANQEQDVFCAICGTVAEHGAPPRASAAFEGARRVNPACIIIDDPSDEASREEKSSDECATLKATDLPVAQGKLAAAKRKRSDADDGSIKCDEDQHASAERTLHRSLKAERQAEQALRSTFAGSGSSRASQALMRALAQIRTSRELCKLRVEVGDDMYCWRVHMPSASFIEDCPPLMLDLDRYAEKYTKMAEVVMELQFPKDYPSAPPFVRVIRPRFRFHTGHVTIGGSICTELLTRGGGQHSWKAGMSISSLLLYLHSTLIDGGGRVDFGSRHHPRPEKDYGDAEARAAFRRVASQHGWTA